MTNVIYVQFVSEKIYIFISNITKKIKVIGLRKLLYWKGYFIGYKNNFKWFDVLVRFKSYAYFHEGWWKQPGPILHSLYITVFCLYVIPKNWYNEIKGQKAQCKSIPFWNNFHLVKIHLNKSTMKILCSNGPNIDHIPEYS